MSARTPSALAITALLATWSLGCEGGLTFVQTGSPPAQTSNVVTPPNDDSDLTTPITIPDDPTERTPGVRQSIRRLTPLQYERAVWVLFRGRLQPGFFDDASPTASLSGYTTEAAANVSTDRAVDQLFQAAEEVALASVDAMEDILPCATSAQDRACLNSFLDTTGRRAFRRPLTDAERTLLTEVFDAARADGMSFEEGVATVIQAILQMPQFLYIVEIGSADGPDERGLIELTSYEVAQRLAFVFTDSLPDDALLEAAAQDLLRDPAEIERQARRLVREHPDAPLARRFAREWMHLGYDLVKDPERFPGFTWETAWSYQQEFERAFTRTLSEGGTLDDLLTTERTEIDQTLADLYGIEDFTPGPDGWAMATLPERHRGLLLRPYFLATHASSTSSSHVKRGYTVLKQLLCSPTGPIPDGALDMVPVYPELSTSRQKSEILRDQLACGGCHTMIDHIGLSLEHYDAVGAWREIAPAEQGAQDIDDSGLIADVGTLSNTDVVGRTFDGAGGLTDLLVESTSVEQCVPRHWFRYALSQLERTDADELTIQQMTDAFEGSGGQLEELFVSLARTEAFRMRYVGEEAQ